MGFSTQPAEYVMRGELANGLFVSVRSSLAPVAEHLRVLPAFGPSLQRDENPAPVAVEILVTEDPAAPQRRFLLEDYYTRIDWLDATHAQVAVNGATGTIEWSGRAEEVALAHLRIYPAGAPESLGMFLRLVASLLLPSRRAALIHASGVVVRGEALVFLGDSGAGKTTTARRAGREGALRMADDLAILRLVNERVFLEACPFDRGGRLPNRAGGSWPVAGAYAVVKSAPLTQDAGQVTNPLATWCAALLSPTGPSGARDSLLALALEFSRAVPPHTLQVRARGPVLPAFPRLIHSSHADSIH